MFSHLDSVCKSQTWLLSFTLRCLQQLKSTRSHGCLRCRIRSSPTNQDQAAMGRMFRQESGAPVCAPAAPTSLSVSVGQSNCLKLRRAPPSCVTRSHFVRAGAIGCVCPMILSCYTANKYGENCCLGCLPGGMTAVRTHMRLTYGIQVSSNWAAL